MAQSPSRKQEFLPQPQSKRQQRFVKVSPALPRARAGTHGPEGAGRPVAAVAPAMVGRLADATPPHLCDALEARSRTATANIDAVFRFRDARNHKSSPQFAATACSLCLQRRERRRSARERQTRKSQCQSAPPHSATKKSFDSDARSTIYFVSAMIYQCFQNRTICRLCTSCQAEGVTDARV